jgi:hypothetical protein
MVWYHMVPASQLPTNGKPCCGEVTLSGQNRGVLPSALPKKTTVTVAAVMMIALQARALHSDDNEEETKLRGRGLLSKSFKDNMF